MTDGFELWRGPSAITGEPIGVVVTHLRRPPLNRKIGDMSQAWVMPLDVPPLDAVRTGADEAVCGSCQFRPRRGGGCYVSIAHTAQRVWWAWRRNGSYTGASWLPDELARKPVRIGAWGDPAAAPLEVWLRLIGAVPGWTGYTHRWRELGEGWATFLMASVDSAEEAREAQALGWRTFRARLRGDELLPGERVCPSAEEAPTYQKAECATCRLCDGVRGRPRRNVAIVVHGAHARTASRWMHAAAQELLFGAK